MINVLFWPEQNDEEEKDLLMSFYSECYPGYRAGDTIYLERYNAPIVKNIVRKDMRLACYKVTRVEHGVREDITDKGPSFSVQAHVYVEREP